MEFSKDNDQYMKAHMEKYSNIYKGEINIGDKKDESSLVNLFANLITADDSQKKMIEVIAKSDISTLSYLIDKLNDKSLSNKDIEQFCAEIAIADIMQNPLF